MRRDGYICPFCFEKHKVNDYQYRCSNPRCKKVPDTELTIYNNGDLNAPVLERKTFHAINKNAVCPLCNNQTFKKICPSCHNTLPKSTIEGKNKIFSIVGYRGSGKSHYVGVVINELINRIAPSFDASFVGFDDSLKRYKEAFYQKLFIDHQLLELTRSSLIDVNNGAYKPLIFNLNMKGKRSTDIVPYTLVFFDTAGEDLNDKDTMSIVNKYIFHSDGIIFLIDPLSIPQIAQSPAMELVSQKIDADDILTCVSDLIRNYQNIQSNRKIQIPVAIAFSKFDAIFSSLPDDLAIKKNSPHCQLGGFCKNDAKNVNDEIRSLLGRWGANAFLSQIDVNYSDYAYFAVSALGIGNFTSIQDGRIPIPTPHRIEDPLLWLLSKNGIIKGV